MLLTSCSPVKHVCVDVQGQASDADELDKALVPELLKGWDCLSHNLQCKAALSSQLLTAKQQLHAYMRSADYVLLHDTQLADIPIHAALSAWLPHLLHVLC